MSTTTMVLIGVGVLSLCCVGSCGVAMLGGVAAGMQSPVVSGAPSAGPSTGFEGTWTYGALTSIDDFRNALTGEYSPPTGTAMAYVFEAGGDCEQYAVVPMSTYSCTSYSVVGHRDCRWRLSGNQLTVGWGEGEQFFKKCGGETTTGSTSPETRTYTVVLAGDALTLTDASGATPFRRAR